MRSLSYYDFARRADQAIPEKFDNRALFFGRIRIQVNVEQATNAQTIISFVKNLDPRFVSNHRPWFYQKP